MGMLLSGCGNESTEDVATKYLELISEGKLGEAKKMVAPKNQELKRVIASCKKEESHKMIKAASEAVKKSCHRNGKFKGKYSESYQKKIFALEKQYGSLLKIPRKEQIKAVYAVINEIAEGDKVKAEMIKFARRGDGEGMAIYAVNTLYDQTDEIKPYCGLVEIKDIKVLHVEKSKEGDKAKVKLEVVFKNGRSLKYNLGLEAIQGEWKMAGGFARPW